jgi:Ca2+-binding EF-hand superfamily protein
MVRTLILIFRNIFLTKGNASKMTAHIFRIFDSDGNDFLDFKEFLMAIDIANRDTGGGKAHRLSLS